MKAVDPRKRYTYKPDWAPEVTVHFVQPHGPTVARNKGEFFQAYIDLFVVEVEGMEVHEDLKGFPWSDLMPTRLANEVFTEISKLNHLETEEKEG